MVSSSVQDSYCTLREKRHMTDQQIYKTLFFFKEMRRYIKCLFYCRNEEKFSQIAFRQIVTCMLGCNTGSLTRGVENFSFIFNYHILKSDCIPSDQLRDKLIMSLSVLQFFFSVWNSILDLFIIRNLTITIFCLFLHWFRIGENWDIPNWNMIQ